MDNLTELQSFPDPNRKLQSLPVILSEVAKRQEYKPRKLRRGKTPKVIVRSGGTVEIEETTLTDRGRAIFYGDSHGLIFPMLEQARQAGILSLPVGSILNADYHADIAVYNSGTYVHTTSWERYGVDQGLWDSANAYNFRPSSSTGEPYPALHAYTNEVTIDEVANLSPQVLSVDLDFFKRMRRGTDEYTEHLAVLKAIARNARIVMVFSSAEWNFDYEKSRPTQSKEQIEHIVGELNSAFLEINQ